MISRLGGWLARMSGWAILATVYVWPTIAYAVRIWRERDLPTEASFDVARHVGLLMRSVGLALTSAAISVLIALPLTFALTRRRAAYSSTALSVAAVCTLLCPPMVLAFGWQVILGRHHNPYVLTVGTWSLWAWPIAGALLAASWSRRGQAAYEAMLLEASAGRAFAQSVAGVLRAPSFVSLFLLAVIFLNEYSVPHACGLTVYATELLGIATSSSIVKDTVVGSTPLVGTLILLGAGCLYGTGAVPLASASHRANSSRLDGGRAYAAFTPTRGPRQDSIGAGARNRSLLWLVCAGVLAAWATPVSALVFRAELVGSVAAAVRAYGRDLAATVCVAAVGGVVAIPIACAVAATIRTSPRVGWIGLTYIAIVGFLPGVWVGEAFIAAYNRPAFASVADHWPVIALAQCARFAWIPTLAMVASLPPFHDIREQATLDGAFGQRRFWAIDWPISSAALIASAGCMMALACGDAVVAGLLCVPDYGPIAILIIEKFHRFEDGMLAALAVSLAGLGFAAAVAIAWGSAGRSGRSKSGGCQPESSNVRPVATPLKRTAL